MNKIKPEKAWPFPKPVSKPFDPFTTPAVPPSDSPEQIVLIPLNQLRESPFNPRKAYPAAELTELAESIKSQGVLQPIAVRKLDEDQRHIEHTHEIVFGHRRSRAARLAGLDEIPCIVRVMTDREAAITQAHENAKRADVTPFEEADSFARLMDEYAMTADQVGDAVAKSRSYVYGRLKLHNTAPSVRAAHTEEGLSTEIAVELARIISHKAQGSALRSVRHPSGTGWLSVREAKQVLKSRGYIVDLELAPFDLGDATLSADVGTCHACPQLSLNNPDAAGEPGTLCFDATCYTTKVERFRQREISELRAAGHRVIEGDEADQYMPHEWAIPRGFERLANACFYDRDADEEVEFDDLVKRLPDPSTAPKKTFISLQGKLHAFVVEDEFNAMLKTLGLADDERDEDDDASPLVLVSPQLRLVRDWNGQFKELKRAALRQLVGRKRTLDELRGLVLREAEFDDDLGLIEEVFGLEEQFKEARQHWVDEGHDEDDFYRGDWLKTWINDCSADQLGAILAAISFEWMLEGAGRSEETAGNALALLASYGVDVNAALKPFEPPPTPSAAARASKGTAAKPKKAKEGAAATRLDGDKGESQAGSAGEEKGGADGAEAGQVEEQGAKA